MNAAVWSVKHPLLVWSISLLTLAGGIAACFQLPRFEDPEFTIKQAQVITRYPGASPKEVAEEVSDRIETAVQEMGQLKRLESRSLRGLSIVTAEVKVATTQYLPASLGTIGFPPILSTHVEPSR